MLLMKNANIYFNTFLLFSFFCKFLLPTMTMAMAMMLMEEDFCIKLNNKFMAIPTVLFINTLCKYDHEGD